MADHHDEDAPDVDYEGEEDDEEQVVDVVVDAPVVGIEGVAAASVPTKGAGDSETDDDDDDDAGPRPSAAPPAAAGKGAGDSETESEGEIEGSGGDGKKDRAVKEEKKAKGDNDKDDDAAARGYRHAPSSKMDRALDAPRETPGKQHPQQQQHNQQQQQRRGDEMDRRDPRGGGGSGRGSRWGGRRDDHFGQGRAPRNEDIFGQGRGAMRKQPFEENVGVYIPPAKRRLLEEQRKQAQEEAEAGVDTADKGANDNATAKETPTPPPPTKSVTPLHLQRSSWENLQRTINGTINRLSPSTIKPLIHSLFSSANLLRGRGVLCRSILRASSASPQYAPAYAALMAVINTKLPECGELLLTRAILEFRRGYKQRDRNAVSSTLALLGHLFNQGMAHELLSLQILTVLLDGDPTEDSVDVAVGYMCVVGRQLAEVSPTGVRAVMERFRGLLHEGSIGRRAQYRIETLLKIKRGGFADYPTIPDEEQLDLVEREDQITFEIGLDDEGLKGEEYLDSFRYEEEYDEREEEWKKIKAEILGEDSDDDDDGESGSGSEESESESEDEKEVPDQALADDSNKKTVVIEDLTETDLVHLRRTIYLTIMSSATFEECTHKLAKMNIPDGREMELINMIIECCSQERTFLRYYGLISGRFCLLHERWQQAFEEAFATQYNTIHRLETNKLRNVAKLFGHLLHTDSVSWSVLGCIHLNEDETTSSSRIFIKILVQEMAEAMGMVTLKQRFDTDNPDPDGPVGEDAAAAAPNALAVRNGPGMPIETSSREWFKGMFPKDNARNTRYAINFFTSIGLGPLTDGMREFLKNAPKLILAQAQAAAAREAAAREKDDDESSVISSSSSDTSSVSSSSSSGSSMSSSSRSSYTSSSSYSSSSSDDSRYRRRKSSNKRGRDRKRSSGRRRSRSYSSSSSSSRSVSSSSRGGGRRNKKRSSKDKRSGSNGALDRSDRHDDASNGGASSGAPTPDAGSKRRSVSQSPPARSSHRGSRKEDRRHDRRRRSYSSSRSRSPSDRGSSGKRRGSSAGEDDRRSRSERKSSSPKLDGEERQQERGGRLKRARSSSYSSASRSSRSPPSRKERRGSKEQGSDGGDRKRSRRSGRTRSNSRSVSRGRD